MRIPGVIGGLGPQTTFDFYMRVQALAFEHQSRARPHILIDSIALPYELEERAIGSGDGLDEIAPYLVEAARRLEGAGADFIVMPCNTLHLLADQIRAAISIPFVSIVDETVAAVADQPIKKVALLATGGTVGENLYDQQLSAVGVRLLKPTKTDQRTLNAMVVRLTNGMQTMADKVIFRDILTALHEKGAEAVLLACTDFHILYDRRAPMPAIDSIEILAQATATLASLSEPQSPDFY